LLSVFGFAWLFSFAGDLDIAASAMIGGTGCGDIVSVMIGQRWLAGLPSPDVTGD